MKIGIIVCSYTGNTLSVAEKLEKAIIAGGGEAVIERIKPKYDKPMQSPMEITYAPDASLYDAIVFASPVQAFSLAPLMKLYLTSAQEIIGKKVCCFVTQMFNKAWLGGSRAVKQMKLLCDGMGEVLYTGIINWSNKEREKQIENLVEDITTTLKGVNL